MFFSRLLVLCGLLLVSACNTGPGWRRAAERTTFSDTPLVVAGDLATYDARPYAPSWIVVQNTHSAPAFLICKVKDTLIKQSSQPLLPGEKVALRVGQGTILLYLSDQKNPERTSVPALLERLPSLELTKKYPTISRL